MQSDILECIGHTPLVRLDRYFVPRSGVSIAAKLEFMNPGGSVKDRIGVSMIIDAEQRGTLPPGGTVIEPTAGNTGIGLAMAAAVRGYRCLFVIPDRFSQEKQILLRALGAEIVLTPTSEGIEGAIAEAQRLAAEIPGAVVMQQFANPANPLAHYQTTGPEIWQQAGAQVDAVVLGAGTGGTFTGVVRYLREQNPRLLAVLVEPYGASLGEGYTGPHKTEGIGVDNPDSVPVLDRSLIDRMVVVRDEEAHQAVQDLALSEGMLVGSSSGAAAHAARQIAEELARSGPGTTANVITLFPDGSERYLSKHIYGAYEQWTT